MTSETASAAEDKPNSNINWTEISYDERWSLGDKQSASERREALKIGIRNLPNHLRAYFRRYEHTVEGGTAVPFSWYPDAPIVPMSKTFWEPVPEGYEEREPREIDEKLGSIFWRPGFFMVTAVKDRSDLILLLCIIVETCEDISSLLSRELTVLGLKFWGWDLWEEEFFRFADMADADWRGQTPLNGEPIENWLSNCSAENGPESELEALRNYNWNIDTYLRDVEKRQDGPETPTFLAAGLIPRGVVTLVLGAKKTGKSTALLQLALNLSRGEREWCGFNIDAEVNKGLVVYMAGEDPESVVFERILRMTGSRKLPRRLVVVNGSEGLDSVLSDYADARVAALIVDPARKYLDGNEDDSGAVDAFFTKIERFAGATGAACIVAHHLVKGANPTNLNAVGEAFRGSSVWTDRPRVTIAMLREPSSGEVVIGIPALHGSPLHNYPSDMMFAGQQRLRRDDATHRLMPKGKPNKEGGPASDETDLVTEAIRVLLQSGAKVTRTGANSLFAHPQKGATLRGMSRKKIENVVQGLVDCGTVLLSSDGRLSLPEESTKP